MKALPEGLDFRQGGSEPRSLFPVGVSEVLSLPLGLVWRAFPPFHTHPQVHVQPISLSHTHSQPHTCTHTTQPYPHAYIHTHTTHACSHSHSHRYNTHIAHCSYTSLITHPVYPHTLTPTQIHAPCNTHPTLTHPHSHSTHVLIHTHTSPFPTPTHVTHTHTLTRTHSHVVMHVHIFTIQYDFRSHRRELSFIYERRGDATFRSR